MAAAAKIVFLTGNEINSHTAAGIEVGDILFFIGVDGNKDTFCVCLTFKNTLLVGQKDTARDGSPFFLSPSAPHSLP